jgi:1,4-dihydroxy-2-naphthoate octaprenyltransferase
MAAAATAIGVGLVTATYIYTVAGLPVVWIAIASIAGAFAYTGGPFPLAYHGLGDLFVVVFFGIIAVCGTFYVHTLTLTLPVFILSLAVGLLTTAILVVNNLRDRSTDATAAKRTLVVRFGAAFGRWEYTLLIIAAFALPACLVLFQLAPTRWLLCWIALPFGLQQIAAIHRADGAALNVHLGRTAQLGMLFAVLLAAGVAT